MMKLLFILMYYSIFCIFFDVCLTISEPHILVVELSASGDFLDIVPKIMEIEVTLKEIPSEEIKIEDVSLEKAKLKELNNGNNAILKKWIKVLIRKCQL